MNIHIKRITPVPDKGLVWVTLILRGEDAEQYQKEKYPLLLSQQAELGLQIGEIDQACAERIADASGVCRAYVKGLTSLSYGDQSVRGLTYKLVQKGCARAHAERAVQMLAEAGYLREDDAALREAERSVAKHRSRRRVEYDLQAKGYDARSEDVRAYLDEVDFDEICRIALQKSCRHGLPEGEERKKLYQKMLAQGFTSAQLREAFIRISIRAAAVPRVLRVPRWAAQRPPAAARVLRAWLRWLARSLPTFLPNWKLASGNWPSRRSRPSVLRVLPVSTSCWTAKAANSSSTRSTPFPVLSPITCGKPAA